MKFIIILAVFAFGGYFSFSQFMPSEVTVDGVKSSLGNTLDSARKAAKQLEGTSVMENTDDPSKIQAVNSDTLATMLLAGGCFWCVEADIEKLSGVATAVSGYAGGATENPTYENYASGGHREVVLVTYDPKVVSYEEILIYALKHMDPTDGAGSFGDRGDSYAPAFYFQNESEENIINELIAEIDDKGPYGKKLTVAVLATPTFYVAEDYHQDYYKGTLSSLRYKYYRTASGRDAFITKYWGTDTGASLPWREELAKNKNKINTFMNENKWLSYVKPKADILKASLEDVIFSVTQKKGTERAGSSPLDKNYDRGIYVDVLSGEPLFSSKDKFDSGTGWPSFVRPLEVTAVTEHEDNTFFSKRVEVRSKIADNHLGHVFADGPKDRGGLRYCLNGVSLVFVPEAEMVEKGYGEYLGLI